jgi:hypothetical protein
MKTQKELNKKQIRVLDDFFSEAVQEESVLKKNKVRSAVYKRWLLTDDFFDEFIKRAKRKTKFMIAQYSHIATAKLIELTDCEKEETARKSCLDIITLQMNSPETAVGQTEDNKSDFVISDKKASKLLAVLAEDEE